MDPVVTMSGIPSPLTSPTATLASDTPEEVFSAEYQLNASNVPSPFPKATAMLAGPGYSGSYPESTRSPLPSPFKSAITTDVRAPPKAGTESEPFAVNVPSPFPRAIVNGPGTKVSGAPIADNTRSGVPSPLRSPTAATYEEIPGRAELLPG